MTRSFPLDTKTYRIGTLTVVALVALRIVIGWHFYREGADKIAEGDWTSAQFMVIAKGPLTPFYHWLVWDLDGRARLDKEATLESWDQFRQRVIDHYRFDEEQAEQAQQVFETRRDQYEWFFDVYGEEIEMYLKGLDRRTANRRDPAKRQVPSLRQQSELIEWEMRREVQPWLREIDELRKNYERDLLAIATPEQAGRRRTPSIPLPGRHLMDTNFIDVFVPYFDIVVGALLILGLCTRLAALAGAGFLVGIVLTQWPWAPGALPVHYQVIELFALLVIAAVGAGRFAGLDYFCNLLWRRYCCPEDEEGSCLPSFIRRFSCCAPKTEEKSCT